MLRKVKNQNVMNLFSGEDELTKNYKEAQDIVQLKNEKEKNIDDVIEEQKSKKLSNKDDGYKTVKSIMSTGIGGILSNDGGSSKASTEGSLNTIWGKKEIKATLPVKKENIAAIELEKEEEIKVKKQKDKERCESIPSFGEGEVFSQKNGENEGSFKFLSGKNNMSIFDNDDFERIPDKTSGEMITEESQKRKEQKDESWKVSTKALSSKDITSKLFDKLTKK